MSLYFTNTLDQDSPYAEVVWLDSDVSDDEEEFVPSLEPPILTSVKDYFLKQSNTHYSNASTMESGSSFNSESTLDREEDNFFELDRMNLSWDANSVTQKLNTKNSDSAVDKVRKAIDKTIDNGIERVDISHAGLTEIPDEIKELQYVTVVHNDVVKTASLQIYLYDNALTSINPILFHLKTLSVLSLRSNRLTTIPPDIALLENLVELSLGNNQLTMIPSELLGLKKLTTLSLFPNPFLPLPTDHCHHQRLNTRRASLKEVATRQLLSTTSVDALAKNSYIPQDILQQFQSISSKVHCCTQCKISFHAPDIEELVWRTILGNHHIPTLFRYCSIRCCNTFHSSITTTS